MIFDILTLFPEYFSEHRRHGVVGRAAAKGLIDKILKLPHMVSVNVIEL